MNKTNIVQQRIGLFLLGLALVCATMFSHLNPAYAQSGIDERQIGQGFSCSGGSASGSLISELGCNSGAKEGKLLSKFVCEFENIVADTLGDTYCAVNDEMKATVVAALTLMVTFFGVALLMGVSPFTAKELMILAAKFSLVLAFATNAEYMIGIAYKFFMAGAKNGIAIVVSHLFQGQSFQTLNDVLEYFDEQILEVISSGAKESEEGNDCKNAIFAMIALVAAALPPLFFIAIYFLFKLLWMILRAVFGYCQSVLVISFLIVLGPIYCCFALFKPTRSLFDKWVQYLISFSFQIVIVFAFLGMVFSILNHMADDIQDYLDLVKPYKGEITLNGMSLPIPGCGICELAKTGPKEKPKCKSDKVLHPGQMSKNTDFLHFASVKVMAMLIMFYILDMMMDFAPQMARHLAGPKYAGQVGGGDTGGQQEVSMAMPGEHLKDSFISGFIDGYARGGHTPGAMSAGFSSGMNRLIFGSSGRNAQGQKPYSGIIDSLTPYLALGGLVYGSQLMRGSAAGTVPRRGAVSGGTATKSSATSEVGDQTLQADKNLRDQEKIMRANQARADAAREKAQKAAEAARRKAASVLVAGGGDGDDDPASVAAKNMELAHRMGAREAVPPGLADRLEGELSSGLASGTVGKSYQDIYQFIVNRTVGLGDNAATVRTQIAQELSTKITDEAVANILRNMNFGGLG